MKRGRQIGGETMSHYRSKLWDDVINVFIFILLMITQAGRQGYAEDDDNGSELS